MIVPTFFGTRTVPSVFVPPFWDSLSLSAATTTTTTMIIINELPEQFRENFTKIQNIMSCYFFFKEIRYRSKGPYIARWGPAGWKKFFFSKKSLSKKKKEFLFCGKFYKIMIFFLTRRFHCVHVHLPVKRGRIRDQKQK